MLRHYITIDIGTGSTKITLYTSQGQSLETYSFKNIYYKDNNYQDGLFFEPEEIKDKIFQGFRKILASYPNISIDGITSAGARQSIVLIDKEDKDFIGLPNIDNRGKDYLNLIKDPEDIYQKTGKWVTEDFPSMKILGYKKVYPQEYKRTKTFTSLSEWAGFILTGQIAIEPSQACESQLYDIHKKDFCQDLKAKYSLEDLEFPEIYMAGQSLGQLKEEIKKDFPQLENSVFIVGGADTQLAIQGRDLEEDCLMVISGTTSPILTKSKAPFVDKEEVLWINSSLGAKGYITEVNPGATGLNYKNFKEKFLENTSYEELEDYFDTIEEVSVVARLTSLDFSKKESRKEGGFYIKSPFSENLDPKTFAFAIIGDIASSIVKEINNLEGKLGKVHPKIYGYGSGFTSRTLSQMISSLSKKDLVLEEGCFSGTSMGLVSICNSHFNIKNTKKKESTVYEPKDISLYQNYYKVWNDHN